MIVDESSVYRTIFEPSYRTWKANEYGIRDALFAFQIFRIRQSTPTILTILKCYLSGELTRAQTENILRRIENFHFIFTAVTSQRSSGGIASMYSKAARDIRDAGSKDNKQLAIKELSGKLEERVPEYQEFIIGFSDILYSNLYTRQRQLVRYIMMKVDVHLRGETAIDYSQFSIEHIYSQSGSKLAEEVKASIGNLIFVPTKLNSEKLKDNEFKRKKELLKKNKVPIDSAIQDTERWGKKHIEKRLHLIANMAYSEIWKI